MFNYQYRFCTHRHQPLILHCPISLQTKRSCRLLQRTSPQPDASSARHSHHFCRVRENFAFPPPVPVRRCFRYFTGPVQRLSGPHKTTRCSGKGRQVARVSDQFQGPIMSFVGVLVSWWCRSDYAAVASSGTWVMFWQEWLQWVGETDSGGEVTLPAAHGFPAQRTVRCVTPKILHC